MSNDSEQLPPAYKPRVVFAIWVTVTVAIMLALGAVEGLILAAFLLYIALMIVRGHNP